MALEPKPETEEGTLMDGLFFQMNRVREIIRIYKEDAGPAGTIAIAMMELDIKSAEMAMRNGQVIKMMLCYSKLKEYYI